MSLAGDIGDQAAEIQQRDNEIALQLRKPEGPAATGSCLNCGEPLTGGRRWCNSECRDEQQAVRL